MNQSKKQEIRSCTFQMEVTQGTGTIRFPCCCYVEWKTSNGKDATKSQNRVKLLQGKLAFGQTLTLTTPLVYDLNLQSYTKKQSILILYLLSNSRPNDPKLVGRVTIQLGSVANGTSFSEIRQYPLQFCSVEATLTFRVALKEYVLTNLAISDLERSQYSDFEPIASEKNTGKQDSKSQTSKKGMPSIDMSVTNRQNNDKIVQKPSQASFQERLNRLKTEKQQLNSRPSESFSSRLKKQVESKEPQSAISSLGNSREQRMREYELERRARTLNSDFSVPILTKNSDEFDSNKISQKTIPNPGKSQKQMLLNDSPSKKSETLIQNSNKSIEDQFHQIKNEQSSQRVIVQTSGNTKYEEQIGALKTSIEVLQQQNKKLLRQLQSSKSDLASLIIQNQEYKETTSRLSIQISKKNEEISKILSSNYPALIQQLNRSIQEKDQEIQSLVASTFEAEKLFENKQTQLRRQINQLQNYVKGLQQKTTSNRNTTPRKPVTPQNQEKIASNGGSSSELKNLQSQIEDLSYKLQIERKNHENAKIELSEVQQWYREIQQQSERLAVENDELKSKQQQDLVHVKRLREVIDRLQSQKDQEKTSNDELLKKQDIIIMLTQQLSQVNEELNISNQTIQELKQNYQILKQELQHSKKQLDDLQSKYVQQEQNLKKSQEKLQQYSSIIQKNKLQSLSSASAARLKAQQLQSLQKKTSDLIKRMKEKEENLLKMQREIQQLESKLKINQSNTEKIKQRTKILQNEKNADQQIIKSLEKQNRSLKSKSERDQEILNKQINKLKQKLENESNKKKQLSTMLTEVENSSKSAQSSKIKQLEKKISKYIEKQQLLKEQLIMLEQQSNRISDLIQEKQQNEQRLTQSLTTLNQDNIFLRAKINELENQCMLLNERNQGLQAEIELLNAYQPNEPENNQIAQLNKKLIEKNKQLLHQIEEKNLFIAELQKSEGELKGKQVEQLLSTSRIQKERQQYEQKYQQMVDENQKLYREFQKLNSKYKEEISEQSQASQQKIQSLENKIEEFFIKLTQKDVKYAELQLKLKDDKEKFEQEMHEKQYQIEYYSNQVKQLNHSIQGLNEQIGEKEFQLHLAEQKIKQLFENINNLSIKKEEPITSLSPTLVQKCQSLQEEIDRYKSKIDFYEAEIERLHEKQFIQEKQLITVNEELTKFKQNGQEELKHITYLEGELKNFRERQSQYINQIDSLESNENLFKSRYSRLEKDKNEQYLEIEKLKSELESLRIKMSEKSHESTPISKFKQSPSPQKLPSIDISDVVEQINIILGKRKQQQQLQNALRLVIDNNTRQEQQFQRWSRERGLIQEKAKLVSKEVQKVKSSIMKTANKSIAEKTQLTNLLKPAQLVINELINISQHLIELDPYEEQEEQFDSQDQHS